MFSFHGSIVAFDGPLYSLSSALLVTLVDAKGLSPSQIRVPIGGIGVSFTDMTPSSLSFVVAGKSEDPTFSLSLMEFAVLVSYTVSNDISFRFPHSLFKSEVATYPPGEARWCADELLRGSFPPPDRPAGTRTGTFIAMPFAP